jgi:hypothetical protein
MEAGHLPLIFEWCWLGHVTFNKGICIFIESFLGQEHPDVAELSLKHPDLFAGCFRRLAVNKFIFFPREYTGIIRTPFRYYPDSVTVLSGFSSGIIRTAF